MTDGLNEHPKYRAVVADEKLFLSPWHRGLVGPGPGGAAIIRERRAAGVSVLDVHVIGGPECREALVSLPEGERLRQSDRDMLAEWALMTGHVRLWLDDAVVDLTAELLPIGRAETVCSSCGARWAEQSPNFWARVREQGCFPGTCPICGGLLPQAKTGADPPTVPWGAVHSDRNEAGRSP